MFGAEPDPCQHQPQPQPHDQWSSCQPHDQPQPQFQSLVLPLELLEVSQLHELPPDEPLPLPPDDPLPEVEPGVGV